MDEHCVPRTQIPERLYRVQHDKSFTKDVETGLVSSDMKTFTEDTNEFAIAVESHINGIKEEDGSIFISAFASKAQAEDWMCRKWRSYGEGAQILEIETSRLGHGYVYRAGEVAHTLEVDVSETTYEDLHNEYLILHIVPARAIIARRARMVTHGLENKDSEGSDSSNATMTASQSSVSTVRSPAQPGLRGQAVLSKSVSRLKGESQYFYSPPGSTC
ncbi:hypothetical protein PCG10_003729 [Penicillium crustosum]|uniref:DUF7587 domain-containing protein n=1 Tax=Penicillium crustosum TaxID=36656 RepID=A0A9P5L8N3_PENCR|nr:hypothetical protein PCG10_003729 [Penicillium crustosum]